MLPDWCTPASSVRRIVTPEGLRDLEVCADGQRLLLVHNATDATIAFESALPWAKGALSLHTSGSHASTRTPFNATDGRVKLDIRAHSHIVLELDLQLH